MPSASNTPDKGSGGNAACNSESTDITLNNAMCRIVGGSSVKTLVDRRENASCPGWGLDCSMPLSGIMVRCANRLRHSEARHDLRAMLDLASTRAFGFGVLRQQAVFTIEILRLFIA